MRVIAPRSFNLNNDNFWSIFPIFMRNSAHHKPIKMSRWLLLSALGCFNACFALDFSLATSMGNVARTIGRSKQCQLDVTTVEKQRDAVIEKAAALNLINREMALDQAKREEWQAERDFQSNADANCNKQQQSLDKLSAYLTDTLAKFDDVEHPKTLVEWAGLTETDWKQAIPEGDRTPWFEARLFNRSTRRAEWALVRLSDNYHVVVREDRSTPTKYIPFGDIAFMTATGVAQNQDLIFTATLNSGMEIKFPSTYVVPCSDDECYGRWLRSGGPRHNSTVEVFGSQLGGSPLRPGVGSERSSNPLRVEFGQVHTIRPLSKSQISVIRPGMDRRRVKDPSAFDFKWLYVLSGSDQAAIDNASATALRNASNARKSIDWGLYGKSPF